MDTQKICLDGLLDIKFHSNISYVRVSKIYFFYIGKYFHVLDDLRLIEISELLAVFAHYCQMITNGLTPFHIYYCRRRINRVSYISNRKDKKDCRLHDTIHSSNFRILFFEEKWKFLSWFPIKERA